VSGWFPKPSVASERRVATGRLTMNIVEAGSGPAVLLIHGLGWDHSLWNPTVEKLAAHYHVIAADTRGHGGTDKPDGPYDMDMFARDYAALADALGQELVVFPSHHSGFAGDEFGYPGEPEAFAARLREVLGDD